MKAIKIIFRIISSPIIMCLIFISGLKWMFLGGYHFIRYGGEVAVYDPEINITTIKDNYAILLKIMRDAAEDDPEGAEEFLQEAREELKKKGPSL